MLRRTKIVATLGPATDDPKTLRAMLLAGVNVVRINFSHGTAQQQQARIESVREIAAQENIEVAILADLQGPKIRVSRFKTGSALLKQNAKFVLDAELEVDAGTTTHVGIDYKDLPKDVKSDDLLLLDDGRITLRVIRVEGPRIICQVETGGALKNNKGINRLGGGLSAGALTEKDKADIVQAAKYEADYLAVSFPRCALDILLTRELLKAAGGNAGIIAKIERAEAVSAIDEIIKASDAVMIARGDLAVEIGEAEVPAVQKKIIMRARELDKPTITATQMMESMITSSVPTRAEVSDVANAVLDSTDAVMLSAETAAGKYPVKVVETMAHVCLVAEQHALTQVLGQRAEADFNRIDEAIAMAAMFVANRMDIKAIISLTESGQTPLWMSRIRSEIPIFGLSRKSKSRHRMALYRDVYPIEFDITKIKSADVNQAAIEVLLTRNHITPGDHVLITRGDSRGGGGGTNNLKIMSV